MLSRFKNVGYVFADDLFTDQNNINDAMLPALRAFDRVYVIKEYHNKKISNKHLDLLSKENVKVAGVIKSTTNSPRETIVSEFSTRIDARNHRADITNNFYVSQVPIDHDILKANTYAIHVTEDKNESAYKKEINTTPRLTIGHFLTMMQGLEAEISRLQTKYKSDLKDDDSLAAIIVTRRINKLRTTRDTLTEQFRNNNLTHSKALTELKSLQTRMAHTSRIKGFFTSIFGMKQHTKGAKTLSDLRKKMQAPAMVIRVKK